MPLRTEPSHGWMSSERASAVLMDAICWMGVGEP